MSFSFSSYGDWSRAGVAMRALSTNLLPAFTAQMDSDGNFVKTSLIQHIESQDLGWTPLSERTVALKHGDTTIYVETGFLKNNLKVRKIRAPKDGYSLFIGANPWTTTADGMKLSDILIYLEYGTDKIPARPLVRPTWDGIAPIIKANWRSLLKDLIGGK